MTDLPPMSPPPNADDDAFERAVVWLTRLREDKSTGKGSETLAAFQAWLGADPRHGTAFAEAERLWGRLELPARRLASAEEASRRRARRGGVYRAWAMAACLALLIAGAWEWRDDIAIGLQSDYATGVGGRSPVRLTDGSQITLNTNSAIAVDMNGANRHVRLLRGEAWFDVAPDAARPFSVNTPTGHVHVTGTQFNLRVNDRGAEVSLAEGEARLSTDQGPTVILTPGHAARLTEAGISTPETFDRTMVTAWLRGQFVFYETPLAQVVAEINRYRPGRIIVADKSLRDLKVSGVFRTDQPDAALGAITNTLPLSATRLTNFLVILH